VESINVVSFGRHTVESRGNALVSRCCGGIGRVLGSSPANDGGGGIAGAWLPLPHAAAVSAAQPKMERRRFILLLEARLFRVFRVFQVFRAAKGATEEKRPDALGRRQRGGKAQSAGPC
jgi:hypothetical protein